MINFLSLSPGRYRRFGTPSQFKVYSQKEIEEAIRKYNGILDCYLSLSEHEIMGSTIFTIPLFLAMDFDSSENYTLQDTEKEARMAMEWLQSRGISYLFNFSGGGHHIIIPLYTTIPANNIQFKLFYKFITNEIRFHTLDSKCFEIMRILRIPETINMKNGRLCKTLEEFEGDKLNLFEFGNPDNASLEIECRNFQKKETICYFPHSLYSCLDELVKNKEAGDSERWMWVHALKGRGLSIDEMMDSIKELNWSDFNESKTRYYLEYAMKRGCTISCSLIKSYGLCLEENCPYKKK